jgi:phosphoenolpyruvate-protein kinase (PTS system EI component)
MRSDEFELHGEHKERNPDLGLHGIRHLLQSPELLTAEMLAVHRVCCELPGRVLFSLPFIIEREEMDAVVKLSLEAGIPELPLGVFVETPAAVFETPAFLSRGVRTVFIGTNDLTQTMLCCDRSNARVASLADPKKRPYFTLSAGLPLYAHDGWSRCFCSRESGTLLFLETGEWYNRVFYLFRRI